MKAKQIFEGHIDIPICDYYRHQNEKHNDLSKQKGGIQRLCESLERELTIVGSRPRMGSTSLMLSMALEMAKAGYQVIYYAHPCQKIRERIAMYIDWKDGRKPCPIKEDIPFYYGNIFVSEDWHTIKSSLWDEVREIGPWCIFIDSLQDTVIEDRLINNGLSPEEFLCRELRDMADLLDARIVLAAGLNLNTEERCGIEGKLPQLGDFRGGDLAYYAQKIIFPYRPEYYHIYNDERTGEDIRGCMYIYGSNLDDCEGMKLRFDYRTGRVYDPAQEQWVTEEKVAPKTNDSPSGESDLPF